MFSALRASGVREPRAQRAHALVVEAVAGAQVVGDLPNQLVVMPLALTDQVYVCGDQPMATATGALVSSNSAGSNRASRLLYSLANAGQIVKFRPSGPTYQE